MPKFELACLGGTFDHLHLGHQFFLTEAFKIAQKVIVGLTSDQYTQDKILPETIFKFKKRKQELEAFLKKKGFLKRTQIVKIEGPFSPKILNPEIQALIVTEKTKEEAPFLNQKRQEKGLPPLEVMLVPLVVGKDGQCLTAARIRRGEIDRQGNLFVEQKFYEKTLVLPQKLRPQLKKPLGELILGSEEKLKQAASKVKKRLENQPPTIFITVGDVTTLSLINEGIVPDLSIVDFKVGRKEIYQNITELGFHPKIRVKEITSLAGTLNRDVFLTIREGMKNFLKLRQRLVIRVFGEEDLTALPAVLFTPLSSLVCYGQPGEGIVTIKVTEGKKKEIRKLVRQFEVKERE